jgi:hypothetical protein
MRHIGTLIAAIVIGPLAWILIAFGQDRSAAAFAKAASTHAFHTGDFVRPLIYLAAAGLLLGLVATLRFSPLGAGLTGVVYVASYVWLLIDPKGLVDLFNRQLSIAGQHADPTLPVQTGTTLIVGALLVVALFSGARWRRWPKAVPATEPTPAGTGPDGEELYGLGPGDPSMFRAAGSDTEAPSAHTGEEPTQSNVPAQAAPAEPARWQAGSTAATESPTRLINPERTATEPAGSAGRTPPGSPWSTPLRDEDDK